MGDATPGYALEVLPSNSVGDSLQAFFYEKGSATKQESAIYRTYTAADVRDKSIKCGL